jgi:hypothetical protein
VPTRASGVGANQTSSNLLSAVVHPTRRKDPLLWSLEGARRRVGLREDERRRGRRSNSLGHVGGGEDPPWSLAACFEEVLSEGLTGSGWQQHDLW